MLSQFPARNMCSCWNNWKDENRISIFDIKINQEKQWNWSCGGGKNIKINLKAIILRKINRVKWLMTHVAAASFYQEQKSKHGGLIQLHPAADRLTQEVLKRGELWVSWCANCKLHCTISQRSNMKKTKNNKTNVAPYEMTKFWSFHTDLPWIVRSLKLWQHHQTK